MQSKGRNPFPINNYLGPSLFCDRNKELSTVIEAFENSRPLLLYSPRRYGKTGLIHHFQHHLKKKKKTLTIYVDMLDTSNDAEFISKLVSVCVQEIEKKQQGIIGKIGQYFSRLRPTVSFDPNTGVPEVVLNVASAKEVQLTLSILANLLNEQKRPIQVAIDEFQQIATYDQTVIDASIRSYFHKMPNVHFLFSGSQRHLLLGLFSDPAKPLFSIAQHMTIGKIEEDIYRTFIIKKFKGAKRTIKEEATDELLHWTKLHTFYTQFMCNRLYALPNQEIGLAEVEAIKNQIFFEFEVAFSGTRSLVSKNQWKLLVGIAEEGSISKMTKTFYSKNNLAVTTAKQALEVMVDKLIVLEQIGEKGSQFEVYDPFFSRWIEKVS